MSQGPLPVALGGDAGRQRAACGARRCVDEMAASTTTSPGSRSSASPCRRSATASTLADETDQYGLPHRARDLLLVRQRQAADRPRAALHEPGAGGGRRPRDLAADRRHLPPQRHRPHGRRPAHQRGRRRLPQLGHPQSVDLRRLGVPDRAAASTRRSPSRRSPAAPATGSGRWRRGASCRGGRRGRTGACA